MKKAFFEIVETDQLVEVFDLAVQDGHVVVRLDQRFRAGRRAYVLLQ